jgi:hypothetical protein
VIAYRPSYWRTRPDSLAGMLGLQIEAAVEISKTQPENPYRGCRLESRRGYQKTSLQGGGYAPRAA